MHGCSKECQKSHWHQHKVHCKLAQVYARVRDLVVPNYAMHLVTEQVQAELQKVGNIPKGHAWNFLMYLISVPPTARPTLFGSVTRVVKAEVLEAIDRVKQSNQATYTSEYETRVPKEVRDKYASLATRVEMPFDSRPFIQTPERSGIEIYPCDYAQLDMYKYMHLFTRDEFNQPPVRVTINPWRCPHTAAQCMSEHNFLG